MEVCAEQYYLIQVLLTNDLAPKSCLSCILEVGKHQDILINCFSCKMVKIAILQRSFFLKNTYSHSLQNISWWWGPGFSENVPRTANLNTGIKKDGLKSFPWYLQSILLFYPFLNKGSSIYVMNIISSSLGRHLLLSNLKLLQKVASK